LQDQARQLKEHGRQLHYALALTRLRRSPVAPSFLVPLVPPLPPLPLVPVRLMPQCRAPWHRILLV